MNEIKDLFLSMSDEDLLEAVQEKYNNYTLEALEIAKEELNRRQIPFADNTVFYNSSDEYQLKEESTEEKTLRFQKDKETVQNTLGFIYTSVLILVVLAIIYFSSHSIIYTIQVFGLFGVYCGLGALTWKYVKNDILKNIISATLYFLLLRLVIKFFFPYKAHFDLVDSLVFPIMYAIMTVVEWYRNKKAIPAKKIFVLVVFFTIYIISAVKFRF